VGGALRAEGASGYVATRKVAGHQLGLLVANVNGAPAVTLEPQSSIVALVRWKFVASADAVGRARDLLAFRQKDIDRPPEVLPAVAAEMQVGLDCILSDAHGHPALGHPVAGVLGFIENGLIGRLLEAAVRPST
jgi:hypothetical protein